jgi:hypothetical protein
MVGLRPESGTLDSGQRWTRRPKEALRAAWRGPAPLDEQTQRAAPYVVERQLRTASTDRCRTTTVRLIFGALSVWLAVTDSPWWLFAVALCGSAVEVSVLVSTAPRRPAAGPRSGARTVASYTPHLGVSRPAFTKNWTAQPFSSL